MDLVEEIHPAHQDRNSYQSSSSVSRSRREAAPCRFDRAGFASCCSRRSRLGMHAGRSDARVGSPPYLRALLFGGEGRGELVRSSAASLANLLFMSILLDSASQWRILGASYPGAALVVGPLLIAVLRGGADPRKPRCLTAPCFLTGQPIAGARQSG